MESLTHIDITDCHSNGGRVFWVGECECGWRSENEHAPARDARREYVQHVRQALGPHAYYNASVGCQNCGSEHEQLCVIGTQVDSNACTQCGASFLRPNNELWREHETRKDLFDH